MTNTEKEFNYETEQNSPEIVESFLKYMSSQPIRNENAPSIYDKKFSSKYTCDLSATERGEMFSDLYQHLSQNLTRLEEIFGGQLNWTEEYILEFFNVHNDEMQMDTAIMAIYLKQTLENIYPIIQRLNILNEVGSADYNDEL